MDIYNRVHVRNKIFLTRRKSNLYITYINVIKIYIRTILVGKLQVTSGLI